MAITLFVGSLSGATSASAAPASASVDGDPVPVVEVPAPWLWDPERDQRVGAVAYRFEIDDPVAAGELSAWYYLAFLGGGDRLSVFDDTRPGTVGPDAAIAKSQTLAWQVATGLVRGTAEPADVPAWAAVQTGNTDGPSAGLIFTLAYLDVVTSGRLVGHLTVAGTGAIGSDGDVSPVRMVDAKLAAARLAGADVFFAPTIPEGSGPVTVVRSHQGDPSPHRTVGDWLNTFGYERAGRDAARHPETLALVPVSDVRQALAWLCGRTQLADTCALARTAAAATLRRAYPAHPSTESPTRRPAGMHAA